MNDPPLSQSDHHEQPIPELICPSCGQPTPRLNHPVSDPLLDRAATFRSTHRVHVATTIATTKSPTNRSLSLSLSLSLLPISLSLCHNWSSDFDFFVLIFVSLIVYIFWFSVIIFVWILRKCEKHDKNEFSKEFSGTQPNTKNIFQSIFWNATKHLKIFSFLENIFPCIHFTLGIRFTLNQMQPKVKVS